MAVFNISYCTDNSNGLYSDGAIEDEMLALAESGKEMEHDETRWPMIYHFSPLRQNLLNWYQFDADASVLEIGSGCGALTGMLCSKAARVVSCELTYKRALINYERNRKYDNLEIVAGNFFDISFTELFDYVIVCGSLEYAGGILASEAQPYLSFLNGACKYLKEDGKLLLAIENRLGLKYFAGAPEDHVGTLFCGINGYQGNGKIRTFTREELISLAADAGLKLSNCFYPFPDYKFPSEIFTDSSINNRMPECLDKPLFDSHRFSLFSEKTVFKALQKEKTAASFSNSFLFEFGKKEALPNEDFPEYVKINNNRKRKFALSTAIYERKGIVEKRPLYPEGKEHLEKMAKNIWKCGHLEGNRSVWDGTKLTCNFVKGESLKDRLKRFAINGDSDSFWRDINSIRENLESNASTGTPGADFVKVFGDVFPKDNLHWVNNPNVDLISENLFIIGDDTINVIDCEWAFDFKIPSEYILWRTLIQLSDETSFSRLICRKAITEYLKVSDETIEVFLEWERNFAVKYVGISDYSKWYKGVFTCPFDELISEEINQNRIISQLYIFGKNDEEPCQMTVEAEKKNGKYSVFFKIDEIEDAIIRWDPIEGYPCRISDLRCTNCMIKPLNSEVDEDCSGTFVFRTFDPQFVIEKVVDYSQLIGFSFAISPLDWREGYSKRLADTSRLMAECTGISEKSAKKENELTIAIEKLQSQETELLSSIMQLQSQKKELSAGLKQLGKDILATQDALFNSNRRCDDIENSVRELSLENLRLNRELHRINEYCSRHWFKSAVKVILKKRI